MNIAKTLEEISKMDRYEDLMTVLDTATIQWNKMFPDWEIMTISVPRNDPEEKKRIIKLAFKFIDDEEKEKAGKTPLVLYPKN